jgi:hypothetical protein
VPASNGAGTVPLEVFMPDLLHLLRSAPAESVIPSRSNRREPVSLPAGCRNLSSEDQTVVHQIIHGDRSEALLFGRGQLFHVKALTSGGAVVRTAPCTVEEVSRSMPSAAPDPQKVLSLSSTIVALGVFLLGAVAGFSLALQAQDLTVVPRSALRTIDPVQSVPERNTKEFERK